MILSNLNVTVPPLTCISKETSDLTIKSAEETINLKSSPFRSKLFPPEDGYNSPLIPMEAVSPLPSMTAATQKETTNKWFSSTVTALILPTTSFLDTPITDKTMLTLSL